jgi:hypothetical protein
MISAKHETNNQKKKYMVELGDKWKILFNNRKKLTSTNPLQLNWVASEESSLLKNKKIKIK